VKPVNKGYPWNEPSVPNSEVSSFQRAVILEPDEVSLFHMSSLCRVAVHRFHCIRLVGAVHCRCKVELCERRTPRDEQSVSLNEETFSFFKLFPGCAYFTG
jgi:hypothetical protein